MWLCYPTTRELELKRLLAEFHGWAQELDSLWIFISGGHLSAWFGVEVVADLSCRIKTYSDEWLTQALQNPVQGQNYLGWISGSE